MQAMKFGRFSSMEEFASRGSRKRRRMLRSLGWVSAGVTALAVGVVVGRELRERYKFNRRTPYDAYAHAGDHVNDVECGVGI